MIEVKVDNHVVLAALNRLIRAGGDMTPALDAIGDALASSTMLRFRDGVDPRGIIWQALKKTGLPSHLKDTGILSNSITYRVSRNQVTIGTNVAYAAIHQLGGTISHAARSQYAYFKMNKQGEVGNRFVKKSQSNFKQGVTIGAHDVTLPARPFLGLSADDEKSVVDIVRDYLQKAYR